MNMTKTSGMNDTVTSNHSSFADEANTTTTGSMTRAMR